jgi:predicted membrane protein
MSSDNFDRQSKTDWRFERRAHRIHSHRGPGIFLLLIGILLLLKTANLVLFPFWFFSWPMIFLAIGVYLGIKRGFRIGPWLVFLLIGALSLADVINPSLNMDKYNWPIVFIVIGLVFLMRPKKKHWQKWKHGEHQWHHRNAEETDPMYNEGIADDRDFIDVTAVFGGVKKNVLTKTFRGGDIVSFMGGSEIDLTQADFTGRVRIDVTNIFGGTKLLIPSSWDVQNDITAIFGGVDDKRQISGVNLDPGKILILDGTCMFGGIEIRSF